MSHAPLSQSPDSLSAELSQMITTLQAWPSLTSELKAQLHWVSMNESAGIPIDEALQERITKTYQAVRKAQQETHATQTLTQAPLGPQERYWNTLYTHKTIRRTR